jgi:hypothetical protein
MPRPDALVKGAYFGTLSLYRVFFGRAGRRVPRSRPRAREAFGEKEHNSNMMPEASGKRASPGAPARLAGAAGVG